MVTDLDGNFQLQTPQDATISISFGGYKPTEVKAAPVLMVVLRKMPLCWKVQWLLVTVLLKEDVTGSVLAIDADKLTRVWLLRFQTCW